MSGKKDNPPEEITKKIEALKEDNLGLQEKLELQKTKWLYSHHLLASSLLGVVYSVVIAVLLYLLEIYLGQQSYGGDLNIPVSALLVSAFLFLSVIPPILLARAPSFASRLIMFYTVSFPFSLVVIYYTDPMRWMVISGDGTFRLWSAAFLAMIHEIPLLVASSFRQSIERKFGYRTVLDGSAFSFTVHGDLLQIFEQLRTLGDDFTFELRSEDSQTKKLLFFKDEGKKATVIQFFFSQIKDRTRITLVMHSIEKDIPMRLSHDEFNRTARILMKWLEIKGGFAITAASQPSISDIALIESKKSFNRQPFRLPSRHYLAEFLRNHAKDALVIISIIIAIVAYLFPRK